MESVMHRTVAALVVFAVALAGCSGGKDPVDDLPADVPVLTDATGKKVVDAKPANETVTTESGWQVAANKAVVFGRVHDDFNFSLKDAFVSVVGTSHFTTTDATGRYVLHNVTVGTFDLRFEMDQFRAREERVSFKAGQEIRLDVQMLPLQERTGGFNPHMHNFWGAAATRVIMDHELSVNEGIGDAEGAAKGFVPAPMAAAQCGIRACTVDFVLPEQDDGMPSTIWPGTKEIIATLRWEGQLPVTSVRLDYSDPAGDSTPTADVPSGTPVTVAVAPHLQDHGHAKWTAWKFSATLTNAPTAPGFLSGKLHVHIELVKGDIVLDPPHPDFWKGRTVMTIGDTGYSYWPNMAVTPTTADSTSGHHVFRLRPCKEPAEDETPSDCVSIIPPGTGRVQIRFTWLPSSNGAAPFDYSLRYISAEQNPHTVTAADFRAPTLIDEDLDADWRLYEIEIEPDQADGFYMLTSDWAFKWVQDTGLPYNVLQNQYRFNIEVTAFKAD